MPHRYLQELTTASVVAAQQRYGSRPAIERMTAGWDTDATFSDDETAFITERDNFYLATVAENGWPYLQHRGGPPGFLHVLDPVDGHSVLGWADLRLVPAVPVGRQPRHVTPGLAAAHGLRPPTPPQDDLGHGARRRRAGRRIRGPAGKAERARAIGPCGSVVTVVVQRHDWNCPQHITPRFSEAELSDALEPVRDELARLRAENQALREQANEQAGRTP